MSSAKACLVISQYEILLETVSNKQVAAAGAPTEIYDPRGCAGAPVNIPPQKNRSHSEQK